MTISNILVLTGAGFTKNFGGYLADEMWAMIFNHPPIQKNRKLRELLLEDANFENVYSKVIESDDFSSEEKILFREAVEHAYRKLDEQVSRFMPQREDYFSLNNMAKLTFLLSSYGGDERALWFTLNQDLFFERHRNWRAAGAPLFEEQFYRLSGQYTPKPVTLHPYDISQAKLNEDLEKAVKDHAGPSYIKLHGSYCWESYDGTPGMVVGINKEALIEREPLLRCYFDLFRKTLSRDRQKILIIGYGFGDAHINKMLIESIQHYGLELYIICPSEPGKFKESIRPVLEKQATGNFRVLWGAVHGYFPYRLKDIFYENTQTVPWREIETAIKGS